MLRNCMPLTKTVFVFRLEKTDAIKIFGCAQNDTLGVKFVTEEGLFSVVTVGVLKIARIFRIDFISKCFLKSILP